MITTTVNNYHIVEDQERTIGYHGVGGALLEISEFDISTGQPLFIVAGTDPQAEAQRLTHDYPQIQVTEARDLGRVRRVWFGPEVPPNSRWYCLLLRKPA